MSGGFRELEGRLIYMESKQQERVRIGNTDRRQREMKAVLIIGIFFFFNICVEFFGLVFCFYFNIH